MHAAREGRYGQVLDIARTSVGDILKRNQHELTVFDRMWLTVFTLVPPEMFEEWTWFFPTAVCWANLDATLLRLRARGDPL